MEDDIVMKFSSDEESIDKNDLDEEDEELEDSSEQEDNNEIFDNKHNLKYKSRDFKLDDIIKKLQDLQIIKNSFLCPMCNGNMGYYKNDNYTDGHIWRCRKNITHSNDIKINIRTDSILENIKADIRLVYFIL